MPEFRIAHRTPLPVAEAWRRVTDWERHAAQVPFTYTKLLTDGPNREGTRFIARTGLGPLGFDDPMEITLWQPPSPEARCRLTKTGKVLTGWAEIEVHPAVRGPGSYVVWREDLRLTRLPRFLDATTARAGRVVFGYAPRRLRK
ncbi:SRPBCC family protein [Streptomyces sp. N35]|uniref:SRPBCC family protein n=1 Tax=Streptomyces sp. N35 TaxID=2795730 RepID=UPI0018F74ED5|nr:SRPBCC family protein [Streptomyces sp. N35]